MKTLKSSVDKTFAILEHFTILKPEWSITELAKELNSNKSTVYRFLSDMQKRDIMRQDTDTGKYSLGLKLFELGNRVQIQSAFVNKTHPILKKVAENITETVHIAILKNKQAYYVDKVESPQGLKISTNIGTYSPLHATSLGKILLAFSNQDYKKSITQINNTNKLDTYTDNTITNPEKLVQELKKIEKQKYAIDNQEFEIGLICVGVPVFNQKNEIIASLSAAGPANRFKIKELTNYVKILQAGATEIKNKIGTFNL